MKSDKDWRYDALVLASGFIGKSSAVTRPEQVVEAAGKYYAFIQSNGVA